MKRVYEFIFGQHYDGVRVDGLVLDPAPSQRVWNHSPDGFSWGYGGSGPAQLALAILLDAGFEKEEAVRLHQRLKDQFVSRLPQHSATETFDVEDWAENLAPLLP